MFEPGNEKDSYVGKTTEIYKDAIKIARKFLVTSHPVSIWTALQLAFKMLKMLLILLEKRTMMCFKLVRFTCVWRQ